jgi:hypothetical protein
MDSWITPLLEEMIRLLAFDYFVVEPSKSVFNTNLNQSQELFGRKNETMGVIFGCVALLVRPTNGRVLS